MTEAWQECQLYAMHPIQRAGVDEAIKRLLTHLGRPDLYELWLRQYG